MSEVKWIRFRKNNFAIPPLQNLLLKCAVIFPLVTTVNHALRENEPYLRQGAVIVSLSCMAVYGLLEAVQVKRFRINKKNRLTIVDYNYKNLNQK